MIHDDRQQLRRIVIEFERPRYKGIRQLSHLADHPHVLAKDVDIAEELFRRQVSKLTGEVFRVLLRRLKRVFEHLVAYQHWIERGERVHIARKIGVGRNRQGFVEEQRLERAEDHAVLFKSRFRQRRRSLRNPLAQTG